MPKRAPSHTAPLRFYEREWLDLCIKLRSSGLPPAAIRRYAELVRRARQ